MKPAWKTYARGRPRRAPGEMNRTEAAYAAHLEGRKIAGQVEWYAYEAVKLRLAGKTYLTPDFLVMLPSGELQLHEVKGHMEDDAAVKIKVCAEAFPFRFFIVKAKLKRDGGGWEIREINA